MPRLAARVMMAWLVLLAGTHASAQTEPWPEPTAQEEEQQAEDETGDSSASDEEGESGEIESDSSDTGSSARASELAEEGLRYYQNGQYLEALEAFQKAYGLTPTAALAFNTARSYEQLSQWSDAITWYEKYLELETNPRDRSEVLDKLALLRARVGEDPDSPDAAFNARMETGRTAFQRGDYEAAINEFLAALEYKPEEPAPFYNIAKSYEALARYEEAIANYEQYLQLAPNAPDRENVEEIIARLQKSIRERFQPLAVSSEPAGADIFLDDKSVVVGQTNFELKVTPGPHTLYLVLNGYETVEKEFVMPDDKPLTLEFQLTELENTGELAINVAQEGARIFVDGAIVGLSPYGQKKILEEGEHQVQVELPGHYRYSEQVQITRNELSTLDIELEKYKAPGISDGTLSDWGTTLLIVGAVGGTIGFLAPFIFQEFIFERDYFEELGPRDVGGATFYRGPDGPNTRTNGELEALENIQLISAIAGGTIAATGLTFLIIKWVRKTPEPPPGVAGVAATSEPWIQLSVESVAAQPTPNGGAVFGLTGRF
ncbi:MAG: PEGA domain-containing protein [Myxococcota bacterium]